MKKQPILCKVLDIHIIHSLSPNVVNRDDLGQPKRVLVGGSARTRVSSQAWKRAIRGYMSEHLETGTRSRYLAERVAALLQHGDAETREKVALMVLGVIFGDPDWEKGRLTVAIFVSDTEIQQIAGLVDDTWDSLERLVQASDLDAAIKGSPDLASIKSAFKKRFRGRATSADLALFGRMIASDPVLNLPAALSVAHAFGVAATSTEVDFFVSSDDLSRQNNPGGWSVADHQGFNPGEPLYRYYSLDVELLHHNIGEDSVATDQIVRCLLSALDLTMPGGKSTAFASFTRPDFYLAVARQRKDATSLAGAFDRPVVPQREGGLATLAVARLDQHWREYQRVYGGAGATAIALNGMGIAPENASGLQEAGALVNSFEAWVDQVMATILAVEEK